MLQLLLVIGVLLFFGILVMYNRKVIHIISSYTLKSESLFYKLLGKRMKRLSVRFERSVVVKKGTFYFKINKFFKEIIVNLGLSKDDVTPVGLITFITTLSLSFSIVFIWWTKEYMLALPSFAAIFYFFVVLFRFISLMQFEKKEARIMDTEDLIAMDIKGGVYNAILRYRDALHPSMKPYFEEFVDNVQHKGYSFKEAMLLLNDKLGDTFTDFAQKSILYEEKADDNLVEIFSSVVEVNRHRRTLREENGRKFDKLRFEFLVSMGMIAGYAVFAFYSDPFVAMVFKETLFGKLLLIIDIVIITGVLAYISSIKAKFL